MMRRTMVAENRLVQRRWRDAGASLASGSRMAVLFYSALLSAAPWRAARRPREPTLDFRIYPEFGAVDEIDCLLAWRPPPGTFARLGRLRLIYATGAGVDQLFADPEP